MNMPIWKCPRTKTGAMSNHREDSECRINDDIINKSDFQACFRKKHRFASDIQIQIEHRPFKLTSGEHVVFISL